MNDVSEVFLCATGQLSNRSRSELRKAGVIVVEVDDPSQCQFIRATELISGDDMLWAALDALKRTFDSYSSGKGQREQFTINMFELVSAARRKRTEPTKEAQTND